ncbi:MAG: hypothetical protein N3E52_03935 [Candidatus Bathyarchaeota archaeon]|nr:hypothetical protein [Candidatus Bathyarchaeota archaeon]
MQEPSQEPYAACPFCFSEISIEPEVSVQVDESQATFAKPETAELVETTGKSSTCNYYLGYLSERSTKDKIPEECMICKDILECMLKKAK